MAAGEGVTDSSTGGPLLPLPAPAPQPLEDAALDAFLQALVAGITGLPGPMVRPRWQPEPPDYPTGNWCAVGVSDMGHEAGYAAVIHDGAANGGKGQDDLQEHETMDVLCSFYGPNARTYARLLRSGLMIGQNREPLFLARMGLVQVSDLRAVPSLRKQQWRYRMDVNVLIRRAINLDYAVLNLLASTGTLNAAGSAGLIQQSIATPTPEQESNQ